MQGTSRPPSGRSQKRFVRATRLLTTLRKPIGTMGRLIRFESSASSLVQSFAQDETHTRAASEKVGRELSFFSVRFAHGLRRGKPFPSLYCLLDSPQYTDSA